METNMYFLESLSEARRRHGVVHRTASHILQVFSDIDKDPAAHERNEYLVRREEKKARLWFHKAWDITTKITWDGNRN